MTSNMFGIESTHNAIRNPFGVGGEADELRVAASPRVAAARQPWAILRKPFGLTDAAIGSRRRVRKCGTPPRSNSRRTALE